MDCPSRSPRVRSAVNAFIIGVFQGDAVFLFRRRMGDDVFRTPLLLISMHGDGHSIFPAGSSLRGPDIIRAQGRGHCPETWIATVVQEKGLRRCCVTDEYGRYELMRCNRSFPNQAHCAIRCRKWKQTSGY